MSCRRQRCTVLSTLCYPGQTCSPEMGTVLEALLALWWLTHHLRGPLERSRAVCRASLPVGNANLVLANVPTCNSPKRKKRRNIANSMWAAATMGQQVPAQQLQQLLAAAGSTGQEG
jgi:hypothetical protein